MTLNANKKHHLNLKHPKGKEIFGDGEKADVVAENRSPAAWIAWVSATTCSARSTRASLASSKALAIMDLSGYKSFDMIAQATAGR